MYRAALKRASPCVLLFEEAARRRPDARGDALNESNRIGEGIAMKTAFALMLMFCMSWMSPAMTTASVGDDIVSSLPTEVFGSWRTGASPDATPLFGREGLRSRYLWGAVSGGGSQLFVTVAEADAESEAMDAVRFMELLSEKSYSRFRLTDFRKSLHSIPWFQRQGVGGSHAAVVSAQGDFIDSSDRAPFSIKTVYIPLSLSDGVHMRRFILMMDFRGKPYRSEDLELFDRFWRSFSPSEGWMITQASSTRAPASSPSVAQPSSPAPMATENRLAIAEPLREHGQDGGPRSPAAGVLVLDIYE